MEQPPVSHHEDYDKLRLEAQAFYRTIGSCYSPALQQVVLFSSEGFNHIVFTDPRSQRSRASQLSRFRLLPLARQLVKISTTYQEYEETVQKLTVKRHKRTVTVYQTVRYWGIIAIIERRKIKVIVRRIGQHGSAHFWSVIPNWTTGRRRDAKWYLATRRHLKED